MALLRTRTYVGLFSNWSALWMPQCESLMPTNAYGDSQTALRHCGPFRDRNADNCCRKVRYIEGKPGSTVESQGHGGGRCTICRHLTFLHGTPLHVNSSDSNTLTECHYVSDERVCVHYMWRYEAPFRQHSHVEKLLMANGWHLRQLFG